MATPANGRLPEAILTTTSGGKPLTTLAAESYERTSAAFEAKFGIPLRFNSGWTGYRSYVQQVALYNEYGYPRAAQPGTSNHGWGVAGDFALTYGDKHWSWMNTTGRSYGWKPLNESNLKFEPWHWVYDSDRDKHKPKPPPERPEMARKSYSTDKDQAVKEGTWSTVKVTDTGATSVFINSSSGSVDVDSIINLTLTGAIVNKEVQFRFIRVQTDAGGKNPKTVYKYPIMEVNGTGGSTFATLPFKCTVKKNERLRLQIMATGPGTKITSVQSRTDYWKA